MKKLPDNLARILLQRSRINDMTDYITDSGDTECSLDDDNGLVIRSKQSGRQIKMNLVDLFEIADYYSNLGDNS